MNLEVLVSRDYVYCIPLRYIMIETLSFILPKLLFYDPPRLLHYHYNTNNNERMLIISLDFVAFNKSLEKLLLLLLLLSVRK
jgi:hypothetical protein